MKNPSKKTYLAYRKAGDSLAGRFFQFRMHAIDLKEALQYWEKSPEEIFERLYNFSGFPEPFFANNQEYYQRWHRSHLDIILREDLLDLTTVQDIKAIETLVHLLKKRVGSTVSYATGLSRLAKSPLPDGVSQGENLDLPLGRRSANSLRAGDHCRKELSHEVRNSCASLARDLQKDQTTVKRWLEHLENLYIIYRVTPYYKNIARSLLKEPKYYFYDHAQISDESGARLENLVANALLKELHYIEDTTGKRLSLHYLRTKQGHELDFLITVDSKPVHVIEVKTKDDNPSKAFVHFDQFFSGIKKTQLVKHLKMEKTYPTGVEIRSLLTWLAKMPIL